MHRFQLNITNRFLLRLFIYFFTLSFLLYFIVSAPPPPPLSILWAVYSIYENPVPFVFPCHAHCLHPAGSSSWNRRSLRRAATETEEVDPLERSVRLRINLMRVDLCLNTARISSLQWIFLRDQSISSTINSPVIICFAFALVSCGVNIWPEHYETMK